MEKDFEFTATVATRPDVKVGDYKKELKKVYEEKKKQQKKLNETKLKQGEKLGDTHTHLTTNEVIDVLIKSSDVEVPEMLVEEETDRMMSRLIDQSQTLGMSLEQYLRAQGKTSEQLRSEYDKISLRNLKAEFILAHLIKEEKVEVTEKEIEDTIKASGVENAVERMKDPMESMYVKMILQKNKLITKLIEEVEEHEQK
jgi:trigger factor